jgi:hypothetical protein
MRTRALVAATISLCPAALLGSVGSAQAQSQLAPVLQHRTEELGGLTVPALAALEPRFISRAVPTQPDVASFSRQSTRKRTCRRDPRTWIGAVIGAAAAAPLAKVAHDRFENEAASGAGAAATVLALGAAAGAFIGLSTCE